MSSIKELKKQAKKSTTTTVVSKKLLKKQKHESSGFLLQIRSRHPSHNVLRGKIRLPFRSLMRFGSTTEVEDDLKRVELNSVESIKNSASKLRMKRCFTKDGVKTAEWWTTNGKVFFPQGNDKTPNPGFKDLPYPIVAKHHFGSRGNGNYLLNSEKELQSWMSGKDLSNYIFEKFYNYNREYRLHISADGCFYTCRKMLKSDIPKEDRWFRNDSNSVWVLEENPLFDRPTNWKEIEKQCVKALNATGLDLGACDVRVQSAKEEKTGKTRKDVDFIIIEINSAPSMGTITTERYLTELPKVARKKFANQ